MPLQNRVTPFGDFTATRARGTLMGNRGGRLHDAHRELTKRRWTNRAWICCTLEFNNRHRDVWGNSYTELFFLDEVTAFAAGHRPCFECRRKDAERFAVLFAGRDERATAGEMDGRLHAERLDGRAKRLHSCAIDTLPDGAMIARGGNAFALKGGCMLRWSPDGYTEAVPRVRGIDMHLLTPPSIVSVLARGYAPLWHPSADVIAAPAAASTRR
jgi:hypothetical protein